MGMAVCDEQIPTETSANNKYAGLLMNEFKFSDLPVVARASAFGYIVGSCEIISRNIRNDWPTSQGGRVASTKDDRQKQLEAHC